MSTFACPAALKTNTVGTSGEPRVRCKNGNLHVGEEPPLPLQKTPQHPDNALRWRVCEHSHQDTALTVSTVCLVWSICTVSEAITLSAAQDAVPIVTFELIRPTGANSCQGHKHELHMCWHGLLIKHLTDWQQIDQTNICEYSVNHLKSIHQCRITKTPKFVWAQPICDSCSLKDEWKEKPH